MEEGRTRFPAEESHMRQLREPEAVIAIVDDDPSVRRGLQRLIRSALPSTYFGG
jgi:hypothetical protein